MPFVDPYSPFQTSNPNQRVESPPPRPYPELEVLVPCPVPPRPHNPRPVAGLRGPQPPPARVIKGSERRRRIRVPPSLDSTSSSQWVAQVANDIGSVSRNVDQNLLMGASTNQAHLTATRNQPIIENSVALMAESTHLSDLVLVPCGIDEPQPGKQVGQEESRPDCLPPLTPVAGPSQNASTHARDSPLVYRSDALPFIPDESQETRIASQEIPEGTAGVVSACVVSSKDGPSTDVFALTCRSHPPPLNTSGTDEATITPKNVNLPDLKRKVEELTAMPSTSTSHEPEQKRKRIAYQPTGLVRRSARIQNAREASKSQKKQ